MLIFLSKYFSSAKENKNNEKTDIKIDGINVNKEKKVIYFLFALDPSIAISFLIEFLISIKIMEKKSRQDDLEIRSFFYGRRNHKDYRKFRREAESKEETQAKEVYQRRFRTRIKEAVSRDWVIKCGKHNGSYDSDIII